MFSTPGDPGAASLMASGLVAAPSHPGMAGTIGRFEVERTLGGGGMGVVLLARDPDTGERVAVKVIRPELRLDPMVVKLFLNEARHMRQMRHPHIVEVRETGEDPGCPFFVMPYIAGGSLADRLAAGRPLDEGEVQDICLHIAEALEFSHSHGIIHRDLKPHNVLLDAAGHPYLTDFGLARMLFNDSLVDAGRPQCVGTAAYMSPAVAAGKAEDTRCDIYSFGALMYHMLTGRPPYAAPDTQSTLAALRAGPPSPILMVNPEASPRLAQIAERAMARELRDRYAEMGDVLRDLAPASPRGRLGRAWRSLGASRLRRVPKAVLVGSILVGLMAAGTWAGMRILGGWPHPPRQTVTIEALGGWQDVDINVEKGSELRITARGRWQNAPDAGAVTPAGNGMTATGDFPVPGASEFALVARVSGLLFEVGTARQFRTPVTGKLEFCMNDKLGQALDNVGAVKVTVETVRVPPPDPD